MKKTDQELAGMHWRDRWDYEAGLEADAFKLFTAEELYERVEKGKTGLYYRLWDTIGEMAPSLRAANVLCKFIKDHPGEDWMLKRYHCAAALFKLLGMPDPECDNELRKRVQWDHNGEKARQEALVELEAIIQQHFAG